MDPYAPIHGISLERYAELGAELDGITEDGEQERKVGELGIAAADWNAAKDGWTARMQDMSLMGAVATRYMQLYNAALASKGGNTSCSFEDWCCISAAIQVFGYEAAMGHFDVTQGQWTTISAEWQGKMNADPMNMGMRRNQLQEQEAARLRGGGQPRPVSFTESAAGAAPAGGGSAFNPQAAGAMHAAAGQQQVQHWQAHSAAVLNQPGMQGALGMLGAMNKMGGGDGLIAGRAVLVAWSDGNKYPGTITQDGGAQAQVTFPDGSQMWVAKEHLTAS
jgi:hypothetical protein